MPEPQKETRPIFKAYEALLDYAIKDDPDFGGVYSKARDKEVSFETYPALVALTQSYLQNNKFEMLNSETRINQVIDSFEGKWGEGGQYLSTTKTSFATTIQDFDNLVAARDAERNRSLRLIGLLNAALTRCSLELERAYSHPLDITDEMRKAIASLKNDVAKISEKVANLDMQLNIKKRK